MHRAATCLLALIVSFSSLPALAQTIGATSGSINGAVTDESAAHMQNFLDCMKSRQKQNSPVELANRVLLGAHLANESFRSGRRVGWDPVKWTRSQA